MVGAAGAGRIDILNVHRSFITKRGDIVVDALHDVSLSVEPGEFVSLVGPSGCGKSTLLKIIAGLLEPTSGIVTIDGDPVQGPRRSVGIMFQTPELFEWRTVLQNVLLPIEIFKHDKDFHTRRARELLALVELNDFAKALPRELSGGMQQRAALCRVLVADPSVILMDEPFGALDEFTRERLNLELLRIWDDEQKTVVFVTHNIGEAVFLSDRVAVMTSSPGRVISIVDSPLPRPRATHMMRTAEFTETVFDVRKLLGLEQ